MGNRLIIILDKLGYLPLRRAGSALRFRLISALYEHTGLIITTT